MDTIVKSVNIDPESYFSENEIITLIDFVKNNSYYEIQINKKLEEINNQILKMVRL
jgi:hypothetical protein